MGQETPENIDKNTDADVDHTDYRKLVEERVKKEAEALAAANKNKVGLDQGGGDGKITSRFVQDCLYTNELGDGMLYAAIHKNRFLFNKSAGGWMVWAGHHWEDDIMNKSAALVEDVALRYLEEAQEIVNYISDASKNGEKDKIAELQGRQKSIYKRVGRLRSDRGRTNCLKFAHTNPANALAIKGDELDINPMLFACKNGVIDLRTGELRPGRQDDLISKASPVEFTGIATPAPNWEKALGEIFGGNQSMINYLGRLFGYGLTGLTV
jgi:putative DNA primase/helicase